MIASEGLSRLLDCWRQDRTPNQRARDRAVPLAAYFNAVWRGSEIMLKRHEAYRLAIEKFNVPIEHQSRLFVIKSDEEA